MPIVSGDILFKFSTKDGAAGNTTASTGPESLGKYISTTEITSATLHELFDAVTGEENADSDVEYRCIFIHNDHATITFENVRAFLQSEVANGASIAIGVDTTAASDIDDAGAQALEIADEDTAPVGVAFSSPAGWSTGINIGDLAPGECRAIWVRRTAANTSALANDGVTIRVQGESV